MDWLGALAKVVLYSWLGFMLWVFLNGVVYVFWYVLLRKD